MILKKRMKEAACNPEFEEARDEIKRVQTVALAVGDDRLARQSDMEAEDGASAGERPFGRAANLPSTRAKKPTNEDVRPHNWGIAKARPKGREEGAVRGDEWRGRERPPLMANGGAPPESESDRLEPLQESINISDEVRAFVTRLSRFLNRKPSNAQGRPLDHYLQSPNTNNFNLLRLLAATAVIFGHSFALCPNNGGRTDPVIQLLKFTYSGSIAVDMFFFISGIFVSHSLFVDRNIGSFATKRFFRIWPGLTVCLFVTAVLLAGVNSNVRGHILENPLTYTYVLRNSVLDMQWTIPDVIFGGSRDTADVNGSLWTLSLEAKMYCCVLVFGVLGILFYRYATAVASIILAFLLVRYSYLFSGFLDANSQEVRIPVIFFLAGMAAFGLRALVNVRVWHLVCVFVLMLLSRPPTFEFLSYALIAMLTLWLGCSTLVGRLPKLPGDYSYGVYIYGWPIQQMAMTLWPKLGPYQLFGLAMFGVIPCAVASWHLVELPAQNSGKTVARLFSGGVWPGRGWASFLRQSWRGVSWPVAATAVAALGFQLAILGLDNMAAVPLGREIVGFGPNPIVHAVPFNVQPDGNSFIWVKLNAPAKPDFVLVVGGERLQTNVAGDILTARLPWRLFNRPASLPLLVESFQQGQLMRSRSVPFIIQ